jgi:hypothetical protein
MSLYAGGRSNGSPSPDLGGATLALALLTAAADPCEMFVVRMLRDQPTPARWARGTGWSWQRERARGVIWWEFDVLRLGEGETLRR